MSHTKGCMITNRVLVVAGTFEQGVDYVRKKLPITIEGKVVRSQRDVQGQCRECVPYLLVGSWYSDNDARRVLELLGRLGFKQAVNEKGSVFVPKKKGS